MGETKLEVRPLVRVFRYGALELDDPDPKSTAEEVKDFWGDVYPELTQAVIEGPSIRTTGLSTRSGAPSERKARTT